MTAPTVEIRDEPTRLAGERGGRELAARDGNGVRVQVLWDPIADAVTLEVEDPNGSSGLHEAGARERALDAFYHPFAHAA